MEETTRTAAQELLVRLTGDPGATFRPGQLEAVSALVDDRRRVLVVQRTGWDKSAVYFIATRILRDQGAGASILISPLLALMRNQIEMAERAGVRAATINSSNRDEWDAIESQIAAGEVDLVLISPERLNNPRFRADVLPRLVERAGLLIVDEAHCISDWGHDFRPDYRRVARVLDLMPSTLPVLCTTATANTRVIDDIVGQLGADLLVQRGPLDRDSLRLSVVSLPTPAQRLAWLAQVVPTLPGSGIVYCLTVGDTEKVARWLNRKGITAMHYSGEADLDHRLEVESALAANRVKAVVATSALGMGYDKPDLGFVVHYQHPGSPIAYYQQVGRAGRAIDTSHGVLLVGAEDIDIQDFFIGTAFPSKDNAEAVLAILARAGGPVKLADLLDEVNIRQTRLEAMLKVLEVEDAVARYDGGWLRTDLPWRYDDERVAAVTEVRHAEQAAMARYVTTPDCLMALLRAELDDPDAAPCGRCASCTGEVWDVDLGPEAVQEAIDYLRSQNLVIAPRVRWIGGGGGAVDKAERCEPGRALAVYGDGGWGSVVRRCVRHDELAPDELVDAVVSLVKAWGPEPAPTWITWVPSSARRFVPDLAQRVAAVMGMPAVAAVARVRDGGPQREMENSAQQLRNVQGAFEVTSADVRADEPVLLIDDTFDSRWTLTVIGAALRRAGSGPVHPLALAKAVKS